MNSLAPSNETQYALDFPAGQIKKVGGMLAAMCSLQVAKHARGLGSGGRPFPEESGAQTLQ